MFYFLNIIISMQCSTTFPGIARENYRRNSGKVRKKNEKKRQTEIDIPYPELALRKEFPLRRWKPNRKNDEQE